MSTQAPPPSSRPPIQGGGSGKYIAVAVLLGLGMLGLLLFKNSGAEPDPIGAAPPPPVSASAAPPRPNPREDDVPPPPPIEDSGPETGAARTGGGPSSATSSTGCDAKVCGGKVTGELESALAFRAKTAHKCYDDALAQDSTLKGTVKINVRVAANGGLCAANVAANDLGNPVVAACIANRFRQAGRFPAPAGGCLDVDIPISLMPPH